MSVDAIAKKPAEKAYSAEVCNICGCDRSRQIRYFAEWNLGREPVKDISVIRCAGCGVRRRKPAILDEYEETYHAPYVEQGQAIHPHQLSHFADLMSARLREFNARNVRFLDVGCSTGRALQLAATLGFQATGIDYSQWAADHCKSLGFDTRCGSLIGQWPDAEVFDVIHCCHTIEHVPDPLVYIQEMNRLLKHGGQLMMAFPNYASIQRVALGDKWGPWCLDSHLWFFTAGQMVSLLRRNGFQIASCRTLHGYTPNSRIKKRILDIAAVWGFGDGCNIVAVKSK